MTSGTSKSQIFADYCHSLSPTIGKWCPLRAVDVHSLRRLGMYVDGIEIYHHGNHPIKWVRLTGIIVAVDSYAERIIYTLDDSSGVCILCVCPAPPESTATRTILAAASKEKMLASKASSAPRIEPSKPPNPSTPSVAAPRVPWDEVDVGVVVKIKGRVGKYREEMHVDIVKVDVLRSTEMEVKCWSEVLAFRRDVLRVPWVMSADEEERCRRRAVRERKGREDKRAKGKEISSAQHARAKERVERGLKRKQEGGARKRERETDKEREQREDKAKRKREEDADGLDPKNRANYPSLAVRKMLAGKYDALGI